MLSGIIACEPLRPKLCPCVCDFCLCYGNDVAVRESWTLGTATLAFLPALCVLQDALTSTKYLFQERWQDIEEGTEMNVCDLQGRGSRLDSQ